MCGWVPDVGVLVESEDLGALDVRQLFDVLVVVVQGAIGWGVVNTRHGELIVRIQDVWGGWVGGRVGVVVLWKLRDACTPTHTHARARTHTHTHTSTRGMTWGLVELKWCEALSFGVGDWAGLKGESGGVPALL